MSDEEWVRSRLPVRTIEAWPEVRERLIAHSLEDDEVVEWPGEEADDSPETAGTSEPAAAEQAAEPDDGLTDFQRQWLSLEEQEEDESEAPLEPGYHWWEGIPAVLSLIHI